MKKLALLAWLFVWAYAAFPQQVTPNIGLLIQTPPQYPNNWGAITNYNFQKIDTAFAGVGSQWSGAWSSVTAYTAGNFVSYLSNYYLAIQNSTNQNPATQTAYWVQVNGSGSQVYPSAGLAASTGTAWRAPTYHDVVSLWSACGAGYLKFDGTCDTPSGSGGVPFNPDTTKYIFISFSGLYDDNHSLSSAVPVTSWNSDGAGTITVVTTSAHGYAIGDYVDAHTLTGWPNSSTEEPFRGSFQIISAGFTTTQFEFTYTTASHTCSSSCGNVYNANYWGIYQTANMPFIKSHGTVYGYVSSVADMDTNFAANVAPLCAAGAGPNFVIFEAAQNDLSAGDVAPTIEGHFLSLYAQAHTAGCKVIQGSIAAANYGGFADPSIWANVGVLNQFFPQQVQSATNAASGQYIDQYVDYASYLSSTGVQLGGDSAGAYIFAQRTNEAIGTKAGNAPGPIPNTFQWLSGIGINIDNFYNSHQGIGWFDLSDNGHNPCPSPGSGWQCSPVMYLQGPHLHLLNGSGSTDPQLDMFDNQQSTYNNFAWGYDNGSFNNAVLGFHRAGDHSTSNYAGIGVNALSDYTMKFFADGSIVMPFVDPGVATPIGVDTTGKLVPVSSGGGNYFNLAEVAGSTISGSGCAFSGGICTVGTATPGVTITNIPSGYNKLIIRAEWLPAAGGSDDFLVMQINGDGGSDYWWSAVCPLNTGNNSHGNGGTNPGVLFDAGAAGHSSSGTITIQNYGVVTTDGKTFESIGQSWDCAPSGNGGPGSVVGGGWWNNNAAITSIVLTKNSGNNMTAGATFTFEGTN